MEDIVSLRWLTMCPIPPIYKYLSCIKNIMLLWKPIRNYKLKSKNAKKKPKTWHENGNMMMIMRLLPLKLRYRKRILLLKWPKNKLKKLIRNFKKFWSQNAFENSNPKSELAAWSGYSAKEDSFSRSFGPRKKEINNEEERLSLTQVTSD